MASPHLVAPVVCALIAPAAARLGTSAVLAVVVRVSVVVGTLTGPLGRPSAARLAVVPATVGSDAYLPPVVCQREADLCRERRVVGAEVGEEGVPARPCHCDCDPPWSLQTLHPSSPKRSGFHDNDSRSPSRSVSSLTGTDSPCVNTCSPTSCNRTSHRGPV